MILYVPADARSVAPFHVQLELLNRPETPLGYGKDIVLRGTIVRLFRGAPLLSLGSELSFHIWLGDPDEEEAIGSPPFVIYEDLIRLPYVETYLTGQPPKCEIVCYEFQFIPAPSDAPYLPTDSSDPELYEEQILGHNLRWKRWWEFSH
jgi:hypothetical protein